jgi:predicted RNA-binding Zn-ribbon protein involved in translation (DUF1610 family)
MGLLGFLRPQAGPISSRSDFSTETYYCTECGGRLKIESVQDLPSCPGCANRIWEASERTRQAGQTSPSSATLT